MICIFELLVGDCGLQKSSYDTGNPSSIQSITSETSECKRCCLQPTFSLPSVLFREK